MGKIRQQFPEGTGVGGNPGKPLQEVEGYPFSGANRRQRPAYFRNNLALFDDSALGALNRQSDFRVENLEDFLHHRPAADDPGLFGDKPGAPFQVPGNRQDSGDIAGTQVFFQGKAGSFFNYMIRWQEHPSTPALNYSF